MSAAVPNGYGQLRDSLPSYASPQAETRTYKQVPIVRFLLDNDHRGTFNLETVSGDGSTFSKQGQLRNLGGSEGPVSVMSGSYSFVEDGKTYTVNYVADENGFRATGDHLPTPPPMPEALRKAYHEHEQRTFF